MRANLHPPPRLSTFQKLRKLQKKFYIAEMLQKQFLQRYRKSAQGASEERYFRDSASDSPLPLHSLPEDAQLAVIMYGCVLLPGFSSYQPEQRKERNLQGNNVGMPQVIQLPYSSTRGRSSAKIVFELPTIHLRRLSGPSHPLERNTRERRGWDGIAI